MGRGGILIKRDDGLKSRFTEDPLGVRKAEVVTARQKRVQ